MSSVKQAPKPPLIASPLLAGVLFSIVWLAAGALLLSLLLHFTDMKESSLPSSAFLVHSFAALAGGFTAGKRSEKKGWYHGSILGLLYGVMIMIVSFLAQNASLTWHSALLLGAALLAGAFGGMIGVNLKK
ncbi:TIGR04086 family membrane protein [Paenibacillus arenilitoris]|uniref:TIGR04086 family membrane protein n=1 Tax=Paenibacillus arenilitoris TaxID=2772299 RepID=A0A927H8A3_9BACL|nr:TIGR04086 family membrane protein [Paenibacillus arenilitoris]MBD2870424.1 TIGR04086 family membrane protein [Paenibacillus arenilitoris]